MRIKDLYIVPYFLIAILIACNTSYAQKAHIDHVLIAVDNLENAKFEYEKLGFRVIYGGSESKAFNALIFLKDGTLIELIGKGRFPFYYTPLNKVRITRLFGLMKDRITRFPKAPVGLFNYCLFCPNLDSMYNKLQAKKIKCDRPIKLKRTREDGVSISWRLIGTWPYDFPFFIDQYVPPRLSDSAFQQHNNGVIGIDSLEIVTNNFNAYRATYDLLYNESPAVTGPTGMRVVRYQLKNQIIILRESSESFVSFNKNEGSKPYTVYLKPGSPDPNHPSQTNQILQLK